jgi:NMD protein affecting ribosome stability and mRNA decay
MIENSQVKRCYSCGSNNVVIRDYGSGGKDGYCEDCGSYNFLSKWNKRTIEDELLAEINNLKKKYGES